MARKINIPFIFLLGFLAMAWNSYGQEAPKEIVIKGYTSNSKDLTVVPNVPIVIKTDEGKMQQFFSDKDGFYEIHFEVAWFKKAEVYPQITKDVKTPTAPFGFLNIDDRLRIDVTDSVAGKIIFKKDFLLKPEIGCRWFMSILFKKNSAVFDTVYPRRIESFDDSAFYLPLANIRSLAQTLQDNPTIIMEISGHCSADEKDVNALSQRRAQKVVDELVKMGINKNRLVAKGYGITKLKITDAQVAKAKTKQEKEALHAVNRRCVFKILAWDFEDPNAPKKEPEKYHPKVSGEEEK